MYCEVFTQKEYARRKSPCRNPVGERAAALRPQRRIGGEGGTGGVESPLCGIGSDTAHPMQKPLRSLCVLFPPLTAGNVRTQTSFLLYTISSRMSTAFLLFYQVCGISSCFGGRVRRGQADCLRNQSNSHKRPVIPPPLHSPSPNQSRLRTHLRPPSFDGSCEACPAWGTVLSKIRLASHSISASSIAACPLSRRMTK